MLKIKNLIFLISTLFFASGLKSQSFKKGDIIVSVNYGAPNFEAWYNKRNFFNNFGYDNGFFPPTVYSVSQTGVYSIKGEYALSDKFGVGFSSAYWSMDATETFTSGTHQMASLYNIHVYNYTYHLSSLSAAVLSNYHFRKNERMDAYMGIGFGITKHVFTYQYYPDSPGTEEEPDRRKTFKAGIGAHFSASLGMRYYLFPFLGLNLEAGYDTGALFLGGIVFKLRTKKSNVPDKTKIN
jgi:hypothetical protein